MNISSSTKRRRLTVDTDKWVKKFVYSKEDKEKIADQFAFFFQNQIATEFEKKGFIVEDCRQLSFESAFRLHPLFDGLTDQMAFGLFFNLIIKKAYSPSVNIVIVIGETLLISYYNIFQTSLEELSSKTNREISDPKTKIFNLLFFQMNYYYFPANKDTIKLFGHTKKTIGTGIFKANEEELIKKMISIIK